MRKASTASWKRKSEGSATQYAIKTPSVSTTSPCDRIMNRHFPCMLRSFAPENPLMMIEATSARACVSSTHTNRKRRSERNDESPNRRFKKKGGGG